VWRTGNTESSAEGLRTAGSPILGPPVTRTLFSRAIFITETVLLTVLITVALQAFVVQPYRVEHVSMMDTLDDGQMVLVDKLSPRIAGYGRGDIVLFHPPSGIEDDDTPFVKRLIGLPGESIDLADGHVLVNGVALDESAYLYQGKPTEPTGEHSHWVVPAGMFFVLGDHRGDSTDSRSDLLGPIPQSSVIGRAVLRYWPLSAVTLLADPAYPELTTGDATGDGTGQAADQALGSATQRSMLRP
jgi:signal peptidase I